MSSSFLFSGRIFLDGGAVRYFMLKRRLRQKQIARLLGVSEGQFTQYLNGTSRIAPAHLSQLSQILKISDPSILISEGTERAS